MSKLGRRLKTFVAAGLQPCARSGGLKPAGYDTTVLSSLTFIAAIAAAAVLFAQAPVQTPQGQPVFRTLTDLVSVDVGVKSGGTPVASLTTSDFLLTDNGVPQHIESIEMEQVPVDITILVDTNDAIAANVSSFNDDLQKIRAFVRPDDQLRVMQLDTYVTDLLPLKRAGSQPAIARLKPGGLSSAHDGLAAALMRANPERPNLIVAISDTIDSMSTLTSEAVRDIAKQSSATLHISWATMAEEPNKEPVPPGQKDWPLIVWQSAHEREVPFNCGTTGACGGTHRFWVPYSEPSGPRRELHDIANLREATALTGGSIHEPGIFAGRTAAAVFQKVFEDYRRTYLLRYTPQGVSHEGWHDLVVKIPAHTGYEIHARRGYAIDTSGAPSTAAGERLVTAPAGARFGTTIANLVDAYGRADYAGAQSAFQAINDRTRLINDFRSGGNPWPGMPRKEAALVLELAAAVSFDHREDAQKAAQDLLTWYNKLVQPTFEPDGFERDWLWAELSILEATLRPQVTQSFVTHAIARFPNEPRFLLAQAIVTDQLWPVGTNTLGGGPLMSQITDVTAQYDAVMVHPETAFEARVREAFFLHRIGLNEKALTLLDQAGDQSPDAGMLYMRHLFRGEVLDALGRLDDAITAYRAALAIRSDAQSARVALMNAFMKKGDREDARVMADAVQSAAVSGASEPDPWWQYWQGDYRLYPVAMSRVRAQISLEPGR